jgi:hypothetical protein
MAWPFDVGDGSGKAMKKKAYRKALEEYKLREAV